MKEPSEDGPDYNRAEEPEDRRLTATESELDITEMNLGGLEEVLYRLQSRLDGVLRPATPSADDSVKKLEEPLPRIPSRIREINRGVNAASRFVDDLISRLEV